MRQSERLAGLKVRLSRLRLRCAAIALAGEAAALVALVALDVAAAGAAVPDQRLRLGVRALLGVPAVAVLSALQGVGADGLRVAPPALRVRRGRPARAAAGARRAPSSAALRAAGRDRPGRIGRKPAPDLFGRSDGATAAHPADGSLAGRQRPLRSRGEPGRRSPLPAGAVSRFHSVRLAAAAYNAGPGAIVGRAIPRNGQTEIYVQRVLHAFAVERRLRCVPPRRRH